MSTRSRGKRPIPSGTVPRAPGPRRTERVEEPNLELPEDGPLPESDEDWEAPVLHTDGDADWNLAQACPDAGGDVHSGRDDDSGYDEEFAGEHDDEGERGELAGESDRAGRDDDEEELSVDDGEEDGDYEEESVDLGHGLYDEDGAGGDDAGEDEDREGGSGAIGEWLVEEVARDPSREAPLIAIVGRPNVGKSRLFNRMTGTRHSIVHDMPGVTRDRQYGTGEWSERAFRVVDTGGFEPDSDDVLLRQMREQATVAIEEADIVLFVVDVQAGLLPADHEIAGLLRRSGKPVFAVVNKVDGPRLDSDAAEFHALGLDTLVSISAEHGREFDTLMDSLAPFMPLVEEVARPTDDIRVAVLGRPNAGKSTLVNSLLGERRLLTSDIPGTTRDSVNTRIVRGGKRYLFIDTAGIRRKRGIVHLVEKYSVVQAFKAVDRADVVLYLVDAVEGLTVQDQRMLGLVHDKGRAVVLLVNKWDAVQKDPKTADTYIKKLREDLKFNRYAPVVTISARTGQRTHRLFPLIDRVYEQFVRRVGTGEFNRFLEAAVRRNPPGHRGNRLLKVYYGSQVATRPPTFMLVVNEPRAMYFSWERYMRNALREAFGFEGSPVKLFLRARGRREETPSRDSG